MFSGKARFQSKKFKEKPKDTGMLLMTSHEMGHFRTWGCVRDGVTESNDLNEKKSPGQLGGSVS